MPEANLIAAKRVDIKMYKGDTTRLSITFTNDDASAIDLTGKTFKMDIRRVHTSDVVKTLSSGSGIEVSGNGHNILVFDPLNDLDAGDYVCDLQQTAGGETITLFYGPLRIQQDVTVA